MTQPCSTALLRGLAAAILLTPAVAQETTRVSVNGAGAQGNGKSAWQHEPSISADGRFVAFESLAANLVPGDTNGALDVFVHDRQTGMTTRVSVDSAGAQGTRASYAPVISGDGQIVAFHSEAPALVPGDTNGAADVFVHDRATGQTTRVSVSSAGAQSGQDAQYPQLSADGRYVAFFSFAGDLVPGDTNGVSDAFLHDRVTGLTTRVSLSTIGAQGNGHSFPMSLSADGRYVAFESEASNLVAGDNNGATDAFVHDHWTGLTTRVSLDEAGAQVPQGALNPRISADGSLVAFMSVSPFVAGDTNAMTDVYVRNLTTGAVARASVSSAGEQGNQASYVAGISANGRHVIFESSASNLVAGDLNAESDVFVHSLHTGQTLLCSRDTAGVQGNKASWGGQLSADGGSAAFVSFADNLVTGDTNAKSDAFVFERPTGPSLARSGSCPGAITLTVTGATPLNPVAMVHGPAGAFVKPTPPCQGLVLQIAPPALGALVTTDGAGACQLPFNAPPAVCGRSVQAVDIVSCKASNVVVL